MRFALIILLSLQLSSVLSAQCPEFQLVDLQSLQRADNSEKENWLSSHGFDLVAKTGNSFRYTKCWSHYHNGKAIYTHVVYWNTVSGNITYLTPDESLFQQLRKTIEGRHGQTGSLGTSDVYIGQMFRYKFGSQWLDGAMHWSVEVTPK